MSRFGYAELHCLSNFSFQRGASSALELFQRAKKQGYQALAITDECTLAGIVRAWQAAKSVELPLIIGSEIRIENGPKLVLLVESLEGYQALCRLITRARRRTHKGQYQVLREDFGEPLPGLLALWVPDAVDAFAQGHWLKQVFAERLWLAVHQGSARILMGPERIESGWWDGGDVRRDYYLIETRAGQQGWAYRAVGEDGPLWLQGWFA